MIVENNLKEEKNQIAESFLRWSQALLSSRQGLGIVGILEMAVVVFQDQRSIPSDKLFPFRPCRDHMSY